MSYLLILVALALGAWSLFTYNRLVRLRNQVRTAWADVDVQLIRRHDLVPALVTAVQAYAGNEQAALTAVAELRAQAVAAGEVRALASIETALEKGLGRLLALQEAYPELKASDHFAQLQRDFVKVEEHLQYARRFYNGSVRDLNDAVQRFPDLLVARAGGFGQADFFQADVAGRGAVKVELDR